MRHNKKINHLGRKTAHRSAMLSNMATSLIMHKRIFTTVAKAKALRKFVEPIITKSKDDTTNSRRVVFSILQNKHVVTELFQNVSQKVADRPGGYTRILKTGYRLGDNAAMCFIELVDFNENMLTDGAKKAKTRRSRRRKSTGAETAQSTPKAKKEDNVAENAPKTDDVKTNATSSAKEEKTTDVTNNEKKELKSKSVNSEKKEQKPESESKKDDAKSTEENA